MQRNVLESALLQLFRHQGLIEVISIPRNSCSLLMASTSDGRHHPAAVSNCNSSATCKGDGLRAPGVSFPHPHLDERRMLATAAAHAINTVSQPPYLSPITVLHDDARASSQNMQDVPASPSRGSFEDARKREPWPKVGAEDPARAMPDSHRVKSDPPMRQRITTDDIWGGHTLRRATGNVLSRIQMRRPVPVIRKALESTPSSAHRPDEASNSDVSVTERGRERMASDNALGPPPPAPVSLMSNANDQVETIAVAAAALSPQNRSASGSTISSFQQHEPVSTNSVWLEASEASTHDTNFSPHHGFVYSASLEEGYRMYLRSLHHSAKARQRQQTLIEREDVQRSGEAQEGAVGVSPHPDAGFPPESVHTLLLGQKGIESIDVGFDAAREGTGTSTSQCSLPQEPAPPAAPLPSFEEYANAVMSEMKARETALHFEEQRIAKAGRRGAVVEVAGARKLLLQWRDDLAALLKSDQGKVISLLDAARPQQQRGKDGIMQSTSSSSLSRHKSQYYALLYALQPEILAETTAQATLGILLAYPKGRVRFTFLARSVGEAVFDKLRHVCLSRQVMEKERIRRKGLSVLQQARREVSGNEEACLTSDMESVYQDKLEKAETTYLTARRSLKRLRRLIGQLDSTQGFTRRYLLGSVDRLLDLKNWDNDDSIRVGGELINALLQSAKIQSPSVMATDDCGPFADPRGVKFDFLPMSKQHDKDNSHRFSESTLLPLALEPAFVHGLAVDDQTPGNRFKVGFVEIKEAALKQLLQGDISRALYDIKMTPLLVPPRPWTHFKRGGHLTLTTCMTRSHRSQVDMLAAAHQHSQLDLMYHGLNVLGELPWRINADVLDVMEKLLDSLKTDREVDARVKESTVEDSGSDGERRARLADLALQAGLPKATESAVPFSAFSWDATPHLRLSREGISGGQFLVSSGRPLRSEMARQRQLWEKARSSRLDVLSIKSFFTLRLDVARELRNAPRFFYPHNLDFRGRAYPMHPYLNHMGDDVSRGLMTFAEARPLGPRGLDWMLAHVTNMWGQGEDKLSNDERREFARTHMAQIIQSALHPLEPCGDDPLPWWMRGEKPWQLLSACFEVQRAMASGNPETYLSNLPVHQDGSCNGLQHYAALARDKACASAVNMLPVDRPQDVYTAVAAAVQRRVQEDAAATGRSEAIKLLERSGGVIDRKLVKQTVMTTVYGVTAIGARCQIGNRLTERGWTNEAEIFQVARYLADCTFKCMGEVFTNANNVKDWLAHCAQIVSSTGRAVSWTTPLGFPVQQPYKHLREVQVETSLQNVQIFKDDSEPRAQSRPDSTSDQGRARVRVDKRAQTTAFPPNFIHSLDSTHMLMTAIECSKRGVAFAGVHDSFWTHAGSVEVMSKLLRDTFVQLHSSPLLKQLESQLRAQLEEAKKAPDSGKIDPALKLPPMPPMGDLKLDEVKDAQYFFS